MSANPHAIAALKNQMAHASARQALLDAVPVSARAFLTPDRITKIVTTAAHRTPALLNCTPLSILGAVIDIVSVGLEPGGALGQAYLVPYGQQCTPIIGYQGYLALARRSGEIESVNAFIIYSSESYSIEYGGTPSVRHTPKAPSARGEMVAAYAVARFKDGGKHVELMWKEEIDAIRARSKSGNNGPWVTDYEQMAKKTVIRRARHYWPISIEVASAASVEDSIDIGTYRAEESAIDAGAERVEAVFVEEPDVRAAAKKLADDIRKGKVSA